MMRFVQIAVSMAAVVIMTACTETPSVLPSVSQTEPTLGQGKVPKPNILLGLAESYVRSGDCAASAALVEQLGDAAGLWREVSDCWVDELMAINNCNGSIPTSWREAGHHSWDLRADYVEGWLVKSLRGGGVDIDGHIDWIATRRIQSDNCQNNDEKELCYSKIKLAYDHAELTQTGFAIDDPLCRPYISDYDRIYRR